MRSLIISASPREDSSSLRVARAIQRILGEKAIEHDLIDFRENDIPAVGRGDLDPDHLSIFQTKWITGLNTSDLILMVVPEYNWTMPGEWLDALHQTGVPRLAHLFDGRVFATVGVSSGRGGRRPALLTNIILNKLISFLGKESVVSPAIFESHETASCLDERGISQGNAAYDAGLKRFVEYAHRTAIRWV